LKFKVVRSIWVNDDVTRYEIQEIRKLIHKSQEEVQSRGAGGGKEGGREKKGGGKEENKILGVKS
jgi:hypothetical protein